MGQARAILTGLILAGIIAGAGYYIFIADDGSNSPLNETSEITIRIESSQLLNSASYTLYVAGVQEKTWNMNAGQYLECKYTYSSPKSKGVHDIQILVKSLGSIIGDKTNSKTLTVGNSKNYSIILKA